MNFEYVHTLEKTDAKARLEALSEYLENRHGIRCVWDGDNGTIRGKYLVVKIEGDMHIEEDRIRFSGRDPGLLWRKKATNYMQKKLALYLDPKTPIEELPRN